MLYQPFLQVLRNSTASARDLASAISGTALMQVLSRLLWRNTKCLVGSQLKLPVIMEEIHWLAPPSPFEFFENSVLLCRDLLAVVLSRVEFTSVERYIHDRALTECVDALHELMSTDAACDLDSPLATLSGSVNWRLVALLTRARQACTHASLVVINASTAGLSRHAKTAQNGGRGGKCSGFRPSADPTLQVSKNGKLQGTG